MKIKKVGFLSSAEFSEYKNLAKQIARWSAEERCWVIDPAKVAKVGVEVSRDIIQRLGSMSGVVVENVEVVERLLNIMEHFTRAVMNVYEVRPAEKSKNYLYALVAEPVLGEIEEICSFERRVYDPGLGRRVVRKYVLHKVVRPTPIVYRDSQLGEVKVFVPGTVAVIFPRGLLYELCRKYGDEIAFRFCPAILEKSIKAPEWLRDYQRRVFEDAIRALALQGAVTLQMATGAGKTEVAVAIAKALWEAGIVRKVFFVSLSTDLCLQAKRRFEKYGMKDTGVVGAGFFEPEKSFVFATVQSIYRALEEVEDDLEAPVYADKIEDVKLEDIELTKEQKVKLLKEYAKADLVIFDEVQHVPARTVLKVIRFNDKALRVGMSATPWREDGWDKLIYAYMGAIADAKVSASQLIRKGYLVKPKIFMVANFVRAPSGNYQKERKAVYASEERNSLIADVVAKAPKPCLVLVKEIKHGKILLKKIGERLGKDAVVFASGELSASEREKIFDAVRSGRIKVLVATTLADEGLDLPCLASLVLAGGGKSRVRALQRVGRVIRRYGSKRFAVVVDFCDEGTRYFSAHAKEREMLYRSEEEFEVVHVDPSELLEKILPSLDPWSEETPRERIEKRILGMLAEGWRARIVISRGKPYLALYRRANGRFMQRSFGRVENFSFEFLRRIGVDGDGASRAAATRRARDYVGRRRRVHRSAKREAFARELLRRARRSNDYSVSARQIANALRAVYGRMADRAVANLLRAHGRMRVEEVLEAVVGKRGAVIAILKYTRGAKRHYLLRRMGL